MKKLMLYIVASVWNFLFADDAPGKRRVHCLFFSGYETGWPRIPQWNRFIRERFRRYSLLSGLELKYKR
jgi:hypothetical protein